MKARNSLGANLAAMGDGKAAEKAFRDALQMNPFYATAHANLARVLAKAAFALASTSVEIRILSGGLWAKDGKLDEARRDYEIVVKVQPDSGRAHLDLARVLLPLGDREGTISHLRAAAKSSDVASSKLAQQALQNIEPRLSNQVLPARASAGVD